ncbi:hypothetical protein FRC11_005149, partial [Ceratobasidium sp. 423]
VDGSYLRKQEKKLPALLRFSDLPADLMPDRQVTGDTAEISAALDDGSGDKWLNRGSSELVLVADNDGSVGSTKFEDLIDLTSELLGLFMTYNSTHGVSLETRLEDSPNDPEDVRTKSETPQRVIQRARDINWD